MNLADIFSGGVTGWQVVFAIISVVAGWLVARFARRGVRKLAARTPGISESVAQLAATVTQYAIFLVGIGVGLAFLGANIQPLLAMTAVGVVVLVLVLRGVADNFAAGVLLQSRQPIRVGESITVDAAGEPLSGVVHELNGRSVVIVTADGRTVHVPNAAILSDALINESRHGARRSDVVVRARSSPELSLPALIELVDAATRSVDGVHAREHPIIDVLSVSPTRNVVEVRFWHHPLHAREVRSSVVRRISEELASASAVYTVTSRTTAPSLPPPETV